MPKRNRTRSPTVSGPTVPQQAQPNEEEEYLVEVILEVRKQPGQSTEEEYFVKWWNYTEDESTWEPRSCFPEDSAVLQELWLQLEVQGWTREDFTGQCKMHVCMDSIWVEQQRTLVRMFYQGKRWKWCPHERHSISIPPLSRHPEKIRRMPKPFHFVEYDSDGGDGHEEDDEMIAGSKVVQYADILLRWCPGEYDVQERFTVLERVLGNAEARAVCSAANKSDRDPTQRGWRNSGCAAQCGVDAPMHLPSCGTCLGKLYHWTCVLARWSHQEQAKGKCPICLKPNIIFIHMSWVVQRQIERDVNGRMGKARQQCASRIRKRQKRYEMKKLQSGSGEQAGPSDRAKRKQNVLSKEEKMKKSEERAAELFKESLARREGTLHPVLDKARLRKTVIVDTSYSNASGVGRTHQEAD
ncbi:hypothetical protein BDZ89DRAFT_1087405 [Hymenopellis radicata]|nr:hypothetical protein BDZ89DRAFT_1087405 [Hymenopellis radicata]